MTDEQRHHLEERLIQERARVIRALERLDDAATIATAADGELTTYPLHLADQGTDTIEQEKSLMLLGTAGGLLGEIDEALRRVYKEPDRYGTCDSCGTSIALERLDVVPWARHCLDCQRVQENGGGRETRPHLASDNARMNQAFWIAGALLAVAAGLVFRRRLAAARERELLTDDMIRQIEEEGSIVLEPPEPLDHEQIREEEERFWEEATWDEPEEM